MAGNAIVTVSEMEKGLVSEGSLSDMQLEGWASERKFSNIATSYCNHQGDKSDRKAHETREAVAPVSWRCPVPPRIGGILRQGPTLLSEGEGGGGRAQ